MDAERTPSAQISAIGRLSGPAAAQSRSRTVGLLGTPGTVRRAYTDRLIEQFAADCRVLRHGPAELVALAEAKLRHGEVSLSEVRAAVAPLLADPSAGEMDVVVLACTHFPLLADELRASFPPGVALIDSGAAIARRVADLLGPGVAPCPSSSPAPSHIAVLTAEPPGPDGRRTCLSEAGFARVDLFDEAQTATATVA